MSFLGVGPLELIFILLIAILVFGPEDLANRARKLGKLVRKVKHSEAWYTLTHLRYEIEDLPRRLVEDEDFFNDEEWLMGYGVHRIHWQIQPYQPPPEGEHGKYIWNPRKRQNPPHEGGQSGN